MRISIEKRFFSLLLAFVMILSLMPLSVVEVLAASLSTTVLDEKISISGSDDNSLGTGTDNGDGSYTFTMVAESKEECVGLSYQTTYTAKSHTITIANTTQEEVSFSFSYAAASFGAFTIDGTDKSANATGTWEGTLAGGASVVFVLTSVSTNNTTTATLTLSNFVEASSDTFDVTVQPGVNGVVTVNGTAISANTTVTTDFVTGVAVTATANSGYVFLGWQDASGKIVSSASSATIRPNADMTVSAVFAEDGVQGYWSANGSIHSDLNEACQDALNGDGIVVLLNDATLPAGNYTIPAGVTVLIPFDAANTIYGPAPEVLESPSGTQIPSVYRTLTMADGATVTVNGNLEVGAKHHASHGGSIDGGVPYDYFGHIVMNGSSAIVVENGGVLYAWGYVTGSDTASVTAKSGAKVYEKMQVSDYRGGNITSTLALRSCFPFNQYYIQNVEVKETLEYGSTLICHAGIYGNGVETSTVDFMGSGDAMFALSEGTTVTKYYDAATDRLIIDAVGNISMNAISLMGYDTSKFILPFNHNITVNINSGTATINQDIMLQPGATINVAGGATLSLASGKYLYMMDASDWGNYCFGKQLQQISYVPSKGGAPNIRQANSTGAAINLSDAKINVNGTFNVNGQVYASSSGAQIVSTGKTGVINFLTAAPTASTTIKQSTINATSDIINAITNVTVYPALLTNGDATTINTNGITANTTYNYCATCDCWYTGKHVFQITWNANGTTSTSDVHAGKAVSYPGTTPTKTSDNACHYTFAGWATTENGTVLSAIPAATADATYYAVFTTGTHDKATITAGKHYCSACGYLMGSCTDSNFDHICEVGGETMSDCKDDDSNCVCDYENCKKQLAHTAGTAVIENEVGATCTADGSYDTVVYCTVCGGEISRETITVPATGHTAGTAVTENEVDATCTADGSYDTVVYCTVCGGEISRVTTTVPATGHNMQQTAAAVAPTCTAAGSTAVLTCANGCGHTEGGEEVPATGHTDGEAVTENEVAATCTADGSYDTVVYCTVCGAEISRVTTTVPATGHDMQQTADAVAPTCTAAGSTAVLTCANGCGHTEGGEEVPATGHTAGTAVTENEVDATCTADGSYDTVIYCTVCGAETSRVTTTVPATGHDMQQTADAVVPTCTAAGSTAIYTCANGCGHTEGGEEVPATGHTAGTAVTENEVAATCTVDGSYDTVIYCTICDAEISRVSTTVPATGHGEDVTYTNNGETHSATYDCCGAAYVTDEAHKYVEGTCACGAEEPVATGLKGDVTLNGVVDMDDVVALMRHVLQAEIITDATALSNGEVTNDTSLDMDDVVKLMQYVLKAIDSLD